MNIESYDMNSVQHEIDVVKTIPQESYDTAPKWYCGSWGWINEQTGKHQPFFCGSAHCPRQKCKDIFWWKRIERLHIAGDFLHKPPNYPAKFFTLTFRDSLSDGQTWAQWWEPWNKFRYVIGRKYGHFSYMAILEAHKNNNRPHMHGITSLWMPQQEWSTRWSAVGGGPIVDIRVVKDDAFADYFAKDYGLAGYFGKDNMTSAFVKARRRSIFASRDVTAHEKTLRVKDTQSPWILVKEPIYKDGGIDLTKGHEVVYDKSTGVYIVHKST